MDILTVFSSYSGIACGLYNELYVLKCETLDMSDDLAFVSDTEAVFV